MSALRGAGPEVPQAHILLNRGNLMGGVSQPCQEAPRGLGGAGQARRAARLPGSLSLGRGPHIPRPGAGELYHCRRLCMGGAAHGHLTHLTSAGASGPLPSWLVWSWGHWLGRGQGRADLEGAGAGL